MGKDFATVASNIRLARVNIGPLLDRLDYPLDDNRPGTEQLVACLSDFHWEIVGETADEVRLAYVDESDEDFDWDHFTTLAPFLEAGSFYEEAVDGNRIRGGYVGQQQLESNLYQVHSEHLEAGAERTLMESETLTLSHPAKNRAKRATKSQADFPYRLDTSFWRLKDPEWLDARNRRWVEIEKMLDCLNKSKTAIAAIKSYYDKGKMPNWKKFASWENDRRHLDLHCFLWLHPSEDYDVLRELRDAYVSSKEILDEDVLQGLYACLRFGIRYPASGGIHLMEKSRGYEEVIMQTYGQNEQLFRLCFGDLREGHIERFGSGLDQRIEKPSADFVEVYFVATWLCTPLKNGSTEDMVFQYDGVAEWWAEGCARSDQLHEVTSRGDFTKPYTVFATPTLS